MSSHDGPANVILVSMPWAPVTEPSLALATLAGELNNFGISTHALHLNLGLLKYLRFSSYKRIADLYALNDMLFTATFHSNIDSRQKKELTLLAENLLKYDWRWKTDFNTVVELVDYFLYIRNKIIPLYLEDCAKRITQLSPTLVGFTCLFDQTIASVALAKIIKQSQNPLIAFGGYSISGTVGEEVLKYFDHIDVVCSGDGESQIEALANASINRDNLSEVPNSVYRMGPSTGVSKSRIERNTFIKPIDLNKRATPYFDDYFDEIEELRNKERLNVKVDSLPIENSRGCWWGEKHHCTFCGIAQADMKYRQCSAEVTTSLIKFLQNKHNINNFRFIDYILPYNFYHTMLPDLAGFEEKPGIGCEIKANITYEHAKLLKDAGVYEVQPGIESFNSEILKRMSKGVSGIQNIACLIYLHRTGIGINYNLLFGMPNDEARDYYDVTSVIPLLYHLPPPFHCQKVEITRHSELYVKWSQFGYPRPPLPKSIYNIIFSEQYSKEIEIDVNNLAYYFENELDVSGELDAIYKVALHQVGHWKKEYARRDMALSWAGIEGRKIKFTDSRYSQEPKVVEFGRKHLLVIELIDNFIRSKSAIINDLCEQLTKEWVESCIEDLESNRFVFVEKDRVLNLALPEK
ncbi:MAG: RiPP maturation radical SAM protein 1 [Gammaproteobacteria bacterium]|nr:RiPP maturation radical SAM protein 1 [Gammaproteobacteria bacterium]